jgi:hypothetical protein
MKDTTFSGIFLHIGLRLIMSLVGAGLPVTLVQAQLTVVNGSDLNLTPEQLVQNYLIGPGITISNVTYNGSSAVITSNQIGTFQTAGSATTELGLTGGILMTSGKASIAIGPNNSGSAGANTGGGGDPDLDQISGSATHDKAVIEFDFIPQYDTATFQYVFGSEEFFEYCGSYNDAFGFFLSGPGINGPFTNNAINIALMPGSTTMYVTINNICDNVFSRWNNAGGVNFQYDGLTHVFTATAVVQPCSTYHIKLAIADAVDHAYDSGVFLEENSFTSVGVNMTPSNSNPLIGNTAVEGCNDVKINFTLTSPMDYAYTVNYTIGGTAVNGVDYTTIPSSVTFPPGEDSAFITIHPLLDLVPEGPETVILTIQQISCDGSVNADTVTILDYVPMTMEHENDTTVCHGNEVTLHAIASEGLPPYTYHWNVSALTDSIIDVILPVGNNMCVARVEDLCHNNIYDTSYALVHPVPVADAGPDQTIPNGTGTTLDGTASGGYGPYAYSWTSNPPGFTSDMPNPQTGNVYNSTMYILRVTDAESLCESPPDNMLVIIEGGPLSSNPVANPDQVCLGTSTQLFALAGGGAGIYTYSWTSTPQGFTSSEANPVVTPEETTTYHLVLADGFNQVSGSVTVTVLPLPYIHLGPPDSTVCIYDTVILDAGNPGSTYEWSNGAKSRAISIGSTGIGFEAQSYTVIVTNPAGCVDSASITVLFSFSACLGVPEAQAARIRIIPNPSPGDFRFVMDPAERQVEISVFNLLGTEVFHEVAYNQGGKMDREYRLGYLPAGIYILHWTSGSAAGSEKLVIR